MSSSRLHDPVRLPQPPAPLLGRERDCSAVIDLLRHDTVRLVTLTGPGGVGKTHLALEVAGQVGPDLPDGALFVPLATVNDHARMLPTIAEALGLRDGASQTPLDRLISMLRHRRMLLVLDNLEQLPAAAPEIGALISACPHLTVLATSRSPLHLRAEREYPVAPLELPRPDLASTASLAASPAVALFVERARAARPDFALTDASAPAIAEICRRLDGLPLAIELAAAMTRVLTPQALLARMTRRLPLLANGPADLPARHRTLRKTIDWSYGLLGPEEQRLLRRLSVFVGGASLAAIEAVLPPAASPDEDPVIGLVASLVDSSLLSREDGTDENPRFTMLATIQEYAAERLAEEDDPPAVWRCHLAWCLALAQEAEAELTGPDQARWLDVLDRERDNLRTALDRSGDLDPLTGLQLATALWRYWSTRGSLPEGFERLRRLVAGNQDAPDALLAKACCALGNLALDLGDYETAYDAYGHALSLAETLGDTRGIADALNGLGLVNWYRGETDLARTRHQRSLHIRRRLGDRRGEANSLTNLANVLRDSGEAGHARHLHHQALAIRAELGDRGGVGYSALNLGDIARRANDPTDALDWLTQSLEAFREVGDALGVGYAQQALGLLAVQSGQTRRAEAHFADALTIRRHLGDQRGMIECVEGIASVGALLDRGPEAARLFGAAARHRERIKAPLPEPELAVFRPILEAIRASLGADDFANHQADGQALDLQETVAAALALAAEMATLPSSTAAALSAREIEVLRLIATGLTNAEAADRLFLSRRTVDAHMRRIYDKLHLDSRHAVIRFAVEQGLAQG